jgi:hypothetical protein
MCKRILGPVNGILLARAAHFPGSSACEACQGRVGLASLPSCLPYQTLTAPAGFYGGGRDPRSTASRTAPSTCAHLLPGWPGLAWAGLACRDCMKRTLDAKGLPHLGELALANCKDLARLIQW